MRPCLGSVILYSVILPATRSFRYQIVGALHLVATELQAVIRPVGNALAIYQAMNGRCCD